MDYFWLAFIFWVVVFGTVAALIGPRKGYTPMGAFTLGAIFGIFGVAYLAIRDDADDQPVRAASGDVGPPIMVEVYARPTAEASAREFAADAQDMLGEGHEPASQVWQGTSLTVTYRRVH